MSPGVLGIRADGGEGIGAGHVMRGAALADAWRRAGGRVEWFSRPLPPMLSAVVSARTSLVHEITGDDWSTLRAWHTANPGAWICLDGYAFEAGATLLAAAGARTVVIDDDARWSRYDCAVLVNQVPAASALPYRTGPGTTRLLGPEYCLLRDEFVSAPHLAKAFVPAARRLLLSFGGHDTHGQSARVARIIAGMPQSFEADVVAGVVIDPAVARKPSDRVRWHAATDLTGLMRDADIAVVAAGSICWELAYMGLPAITLIVAGNQEHIARSLNDAGIVRTLGWFDHVSDAEIARAIALLCEDPARLEMSRRGRAMVDGRGADRVVQTMIEMAA